MASSRSLHTRNMTRLTHHEHSDCIGVLFFVALSEFFASSFFTVSMTSASVGVRASRRVSPCATVAPS